MGQEESMADTGKMPVLYKKNIAFISFAFILIVWIAVWILKAELDSRTKIFSTEAASFLYWIVAKLLVWILPSVYIIRQTGRTLRGLFRTASWRKTFTWSFSIGGLLVLLHIVWHWIQHTPLLLSELSFSLINVAIVAPIFEEFTMRGAIFGALRQRYSFAVANSITAFLFVLLHCPGWFFTGSLLNNLLTPIGGALAIFAVGWLCGLTAERGKTVAGAMIVHLLNNLTA
jgi:uncharacterized protein